MAETSSQTELRCIVVTPEAKLVDAPCSSVIIPLYDGEIGIQPQHSPMIGRLGFGELKVKMGGDTLHYYVDGGFVQVADNVVSVMTNMAKPSSEVKEDEAQELLDAALAAPVANGEAAIAMRQREINRGRGQLAVARHTREANKSIQAALADYK